LLSKRKKIIKIRLNLLITDSIKHIMPKIYWLAFGITNNG
jgi:hypothetical protein